MKYLIAISFIFVQFNLIAQNSIDSVLAEIGRNNTEIKALRSEMKAKQNSFKTGLNPSNPEVEFNYLWGNPSLMGQRTDFRIVQSFDFPTAYIHRSDIAETMTDQSELEFKSAVRNIFLEANNICSNLTKLNALIAKHQDRAKHATQLRMAYEAKFEAGDANILDLNKAKLNESQIKNELRALIIEREVELNSLASLNGGKPVTFSDSVFVFDPIEVDFNIWFTKTVSSIPELEWLSKEAEKSALEVKLAKSMSLPKVEAGYMSESLTNEQFRGITVGLTIPLWENANTVKTAKTNGLAVENMVFHQKELLFNHLQTIHKQIISLQNEIDLFETEFIKYHNQQLLETSLEAGEISLIEYLMELSFYYEIEEQLLQQKYELSFLINELNKYE